VGQLTSPQDLQVRGPAGGTHYDACHAVAPT
jgi:hypothetical protein